MGCVNGKISGKTVTYQHWKSQQAEKRPRKKQRAHQKQEVRKYRLQLNVINFVFGCFGIYWMFGFSEWYFKVLLLPYLIYFFMDSFSIIEEVTYE